MERPKAPVRVNYRPNSEDPARSCSDCFFFDRPHDSDDGNCFGHKVSATGLCDAFSSAPELESGTAGK